MPSAKRIYIVKLVKESRMLCKHEEAVVHKTATNFFGMFRYRKHKLGMVVPVNPFLSSDSLLKHEQKRIVC